MYTHTHTHTHIYRIHTCVYACIYIQLRMFTWHRTSRVGALGDPFSCRHTNTHIYTYTHTRTQTHTHTHTYTYTYIPVIFIYLSIHSLSLSSCLTFFHVYGVATISRLPKIIGLFCKRALQKRRYSAKETYNFKEHTICSHPYLIYDKHTHKN